jgi:predicted pyridoxine 5'-phosphate oxidase superfamily flavin-nucleotide-binding protein
MVNPSSDVAFSPAVKQVQTERGSRGAYARVERSGGFRTEIDDDLRAFLERIDTCFLATASADGQPYVQHRGGPRGFIRALDSSRLAFVDFSGNRQYVSTGNLRENPRVCLMLIDFEERQRVKIWGTAEMVPLDAKLLAELGDPTYRARAEQVCVITVTAWDVNCPQHISVKLPAEPVTQELRRLETRIRALEAENARLRAGRTAPLHNGLVNSAPSTSSG